MNYNMVATTVFTPLEYGTIGFSEEDAIQKHGEENINTYIDTFEPLEYVFSERENKNCFAKLVCLKNENNKVIGFHYVGPNAGEVTQGYAVALKMGATYEDFIMTVGIHPTTSERIVNMETLKGVDE